MAKRLLLSILLLLAVLPARAEDKASRFDYYVLALSWSPAWCAEKPDRAKSDQCTAGHGFIVHGLWPQYAKGGYPQNCAAPSALPEQVVASILPIMPSRQLIRHQWRKHGSCAGESAERYFKQVRAARERVHVPEFPAKPVRMTAAMLEHAFQRVNPTLGRDGIAVICKAGHVREVRVCLDRGLDIMDCGADVVDRCPRDALLIPPG